VLGIAASAGGLEPLRDIVELLPYDVDLSVLVVVHISRSHPSRLAKLLNRVSKYDVTEAVDGQLLESGNVYVARPDRHLTVFNDRVRLTRAPRENGTRPAADPLFRSMARWHGSSSIGLVLSGMRSDGASGLAEIHRRGGLTLVQDPENALFRPMPEAAIRANKPKVLGTASEIVQAIEQSAGENADEGRSRVLSGGFQALSKENIEQRTSADAYETFQEGALTGLRCPAGAGSLWQRQKNGISRYHWRDGHILSTETFDEAQLDVLESTLWGAVMALEERAEFLRRLQSDRGQLPHQRWSEDIDDIEIQVVQLRGLITSMFSTETAVESA
jgi:two-component system chemotaxis response regulator CheB